MHTHMLALMDSLSDGSRIYELEDHGGGMFCWGGMQWRGQLFRPGVA